MPQAEEIGHAVHFFLHKGHEVVVVQGLFAVGQLFDGFKHEVELVVVELVAHAFKLVAHSVAARVLANDKVALCAAHRLRGHDFVSFAVLEHAVLMDARLVRKGIGTHNGLVVGNGLTNGHGKQARRGVELLGHNVVLKLEVVVAHTQVHNNFFKGRIARTLANTAQGHLCLTHAHAEGGQGVGHGKPEVVVAVHAKDCLVAVGRVADHMVDEGGVFFGHCIAHGVGQVDGGCASLDSGLNHTAGKVTLCARKVLKREFHVARIGGAALYALDDHLKDVFGFFAQLVLHVQG